MNHGIRRTEKRPNHGKPIRRTHRGTAQAGRTDGTDHLADASDCPCRHPAALVAHGRAVPPAGHPGPPEDQQPDQGDVGRPPVQGRDHARPLPAVASADLVCPAARSLSRPARSAVDPPQGLAHLPDRRRARARALVSQHALRNLERTRNAPQPAAERHLPDVQTHRRLHRRHPDYQHPDRPRRHVDPGRTRSFGRRPDAHLPRQHPGAGGGRTALGQRHAASR